MMINNQKVCNKCGIEKSHSSFYFKKSTGRAYGDCIECINAKNKEWSKNNKEKRAEYSKMAYKKDMQDPEKVKLRKIAFDKWRISQDAKFKEYKSGASKRGIDFNLSYQDFLMFWKHSCYYCHSEIETIGLDRINNSIGYCTSNVVACCTDCNMSRRNMIPEEYIIRMMAIHSFYTLGIKRDLSIYHSEPKDTPTSRWKRTKKGKLSIYKKSCKEPLNFKLTDEEFYSFWQKPCRYCGSEISTIGLDKINPNIGYEVGNINPCCTKCNFLKGRGELSDFILRAEKIYKNHITQ